MEGIIPVLFDKDIQFKTVLTGKNCVVMGNSGHIEQVLMNLITNARDAMPRGGSLVVCTDVVAVETHSNASLPPNCEAGEYALLYQFPDTGIGMDKETQERIFEPFFTTKEVGKGTGIGLSIVFGIVKQHRGYIDVTSKPGRGTTFKVYLPLVESRDEEVAENNPKTFLVRSTARRPSSLQRMRRLSWRLPGRYLKSMVIRSYLRQTEKRL